MTDPRILAEFARLEAVVEPDPERPLRMIGLREMNSHNSWMHNSPRLMPDRRRHALHVHPSDAAALGLAEGDEASLSSVDGSVTVRVTLDDDMVAGTVALPHGWGHHGGWKRANAAGGATSNFLAGQVEQLSATYVLNGIPVALAPVASPVATTGVEPAHAPSG
jgi:formate dehydrogenase